MQQQFVETIKIENGKVINLPYHQARMERTIRHFFPERSLQPMPRLAKLIVANNNMTLVKTRVVYGKSGVELIEHVPYSMRNIRSLQVVYDDNINYSYKSTDRSALNNLTAQRGDCDEIIIVKNNLVTDTSFTNLAIFDGNSWLTPRHPLLPGTRRAFLLDKGIIKSLVVPNEFNMGYQSVHTIAEQIKYKFSSAESTTVESLVINRQNLYDEENQKILFPIVVTIIVCLLLPTTAPLVGMLMLGNLFRECGVVKQLTETASNALMYIVVILLGTSVGASTSAEAFLKMSTLKIVFLGLVAFAVGTAAGVLFGKIMCKLTGGKVNPLIGSAGVSAVPMAARVSQKVGAEADPTNFLLMHAMGPNVAGVIGTAVAAGTFMAIFGVF